MSMAPTSVTVAEATSSVTWTGSPAKVREHPVYCGEHPDPATQCIAVSGCISEPARIPLPSESPVCSLGGGAGSLLFL